MWPQKFDELDQRLNPILTKNSLCRPLPVELRVALTLSFLAHGDSPRSASWDYRVGRSTVFKIIPEVCAAIWAVLQPIYLPPMSRERWEVAAEGFLQKWQFPHCCGAIDGKHITIQAPPRSGSEYFNYKQHFSIVLMAVCDHKYRFSWVDIGQYGSISDGGVWSRSDFGAAFQRGEVDLPPPKKLPGSNVMSHHVLVGDEAFPLKTNLMRPYSRINLGDPERIFNYRLSRARRIFENSFGILRARWRILQRVIRCSPENATLIVQALVCLHNFVMAGEDGPEMEGCRRYCPPGMVDGEEDDVPGNWRAEVDNVQMRDLTRLGGNHAPRTATAQRDLLRDYFLSPAGEEQAPWQYARAFRGLVVNE